MRLLRVAVLWAAAAALAAASAGCGSKPVAKVNGEVITEEQFVEALQSGRSNAPAAATILDALVTRAVVAQEAEKQKVAVSESELAQAKAQFQQMDAYQRIWLPLLESGLATEEDVDQEVKSVILVSKLFIKKPELEKFLNQNRERFDRPAEVTFRRIGVETQQEAKEIREQIVAKKATFEQMVRDKSIEPEAAAEGGGQVGPLPKGFSRDRNPELETLLFEKLKLKQLSEPIKVEVLTGPEGEREVRWHLVEVLSRTRPVPATWERSWYVVMQMAIYQPEYYEKISSEIEKLKAEAAVEVFPPKYNSLNAQYQALKSRQPPRFGAPAPEGAQPAAPGKAAPAPPEKAAPPPTTTAPSEEPEPRAAAPTMEAFREALEAKGATVQWVQARRTAVATVSGRSVRVQAGATTATVDGRSIRLAAPAEIRDGRLWVSDDLFSALSASQPKP